MNLEESRKRLYAPPSRRGGRADQANVTLPKFGAAGEVEALLQQDSDLPRCALTKVACHFLEGRIDPSSKEGKSARLEFIHTPV
jgi:hypothetical protein